MTRSCNKSLKTTVLLIRPALIAFCLLFTVGINTLYGATRYAPRYAAIAIEARSGRILHAENADSLTYPASLTKMATLYMAFQALDRGTLRLDQRLPVSQWATLQIPSKIGLRAGDTIAVRDAILALATKSANDISVVLAEALGGTEAHFAHMMTQKARALGMRHTVFYNASGVPHHRQKTTARDMAILSRALWLHFPHHYKHFSAQVFHYRGQSYHNHNKLLGRIPGVDGIKTGFINASGFNLAASAERNGKRIIVVVLGGRTRIGRDQRVVQILNACFDRQRFLSPPQTPVRPRLQAVSYQESGPSIAPAVLPLPKATPKGLKKPFTAPPIASSRKSSPVAQKWAIQLGTFKEAKAAHSANRHALRVVKLAVQRKVAVRPLKSKRNPLYQAQILGLSQIEARKACRALTQKSLPCLVFHTP